MGWFVQLAALREGYADVRAQLETVSQTLDRFKSSNTALLDEKVAFQSQLQQLQQQLREVHQQVDSPSAPSLSPDLKLGLHLTPKNKTTITQPKRKDKIRECIVARN